ncbi:MAG: ferritin-like protein [Rhodothermia bacterium]|nr:ferritin-like protein [Rhodothermia bacterium]
MKVERNVESRRDLVRALRSVAALEHQVMCEYLFAAFSLKKRIGEGGLSPLQLESVREWQSTILLVARQEMEHLGIVSNLLSAVGSTPYFGFGNSRPQLHRFSTATIRHFVEIEEAHDPPEPDINSSGENNGQGESIGEIYARIYDGFVDLGGRMENLFIGASRSQIENADIDLRPGLYHISLKTVSDLDSATAALDHILGASHGDEHAHAERFRQILTEAERSYKSDPDFEPARPVASNPCSISVRANREDATAVTDPVTRQALELFNEAYETMLLMLGRFYSPSDETPEERYTLKRIVFFPMMTMIIRPLGELLTLLPVRDGSDLTAGAGFSFSEPLQLHPDKRVAWLNLHERIRNHIVKATAVHRAVSDRADLNRSELGDRFAFLVQNLEAMSEHFERGMNLKHEYLQHLLKRAF